MYNDVTHPSESVSSFLKASRSSFLCSSGSVSGNSLPCKQTFEHYIFKEITGSKSTIYLKVSHFDLKHIEMNIN